MSIIADYAGWVATPITGIVMYLFGGRQKQKTDAVSSMQIMYQEFLEHFKGQMTTITEEVSGLKLSNSELQSKLNEVQLSFNGLQKNFSQLYLDYSHEVQKNADWNKMYNELNAKYVVLEEQYEKLKKDFEAYKKTKK